MGKGEEKKWDYTVVKALSIAIGLKSDGLAQRSKATKLVKVFFYFEIIAHNLISEMGSCNFTTAAWQGNPIQKLIILKIG